MKMPIIVRVGSQVVQRQGDDDEQVVECPRCAERIVLRRAADDVGMRYGSTAT